MPRKGPATAINDAWRTRVMDRIAEMEITQNELARRAKISKGSLSEALDPGSIQTTVMAEIHVALGWDVPPTGFEPEALELLKLYSQMSERDQGAMIERARNSVENRKKTPPVRK